MKLDLHKWIDEMVGGMLNETTIDELVEGADIDGDSTIEYKRHLQLVGHTFLNLNSVENQVNYIINYVV